MAGFQKGMVDLELDDDSKLDGAIYPTASGEPVKPDYPWGLCISLTEKELAKLDLNGKEAESGHMLEFRAVARVRSVTHTSHESGECCRVELQIEKMAIEE